MLLDGGIHSRTHTWARITLDVNLMWPGCHIHHRSFEALVVTSSDINAAYSEDPTPTQGFFYLWNISKIFSIVRLISIVTICLYTPEIGKSFLRCSNDKHPSHCPLMNVVFNHADGHKVHK